MMIAFYAPDLGLSDAIFATLQKRFAGEDLLRWEPGTPVPNAGITVLLAIGPVTREVLEGLPELELMHVLTAGYETVDVEAATRLGVWVSYSPADVTGNADSVAEFAVLLVLAAARQLMVSLASLRDPKVVKPGNPPTLVQKTVCLVGPGKIGEKIAARLLPFGVHLTAVARTPLHAPKGIPTRPMAELKQAVAEADFVVLAVPATKKTENLFDAEVMAAMKKGAVLVNIARGSLVDEGALYAAIKSGHLGGAGLDVLRHEPIRVDEPLLELPQVFLTPHVAGHTDLMVEGTVEYVARVLGRLKGGRAIESLLNRPTEPRRVLSDGSL